MSGVAVGGAAVLGAGVSLYEGAQADKRAKDMLNQQSSALQDQLDFNKQRYADWKQTYGAVEKNLADYYQNLTPEHLTTLGIQNVQEHYQQQLKQTEQNLAQRGLDTSGILAQVETQYGMKAASDKAKVAANADANVAQQKSQFLGLGLGSKNADQNAISNTMGNISNMYAQQASLANQQANASYAAAANTIGSAAGAYTQYKTVDAFNKTSKTSKTAKGGEV